MTLAVPSLQIETNERAARKAGAHAASARQLLAIGSAALLLRAALFLLVVCRFHVTLDQWVAKGDGESYIAYARAMTGDASRLSEYDRRVFPGYPGLIALAHLAGFGFQAAAVGIDWLSAALAAIFAAAVFRDRRVGWACVMFTPQYLMNSTMAMSEAPLLALTLGGLLAAESVGPAAGGLVLGLAGLVRPMACFAVLGRSLASAARRRWRASLLVPACSAAVVLGGVIVLWLRTGDAFRGVRIYAHAQNTYDGHLFSWPFQSLVQESVSGRAPLTRILYIWTHVLLALAACGALLVSCLRARKHPDARDLLALPWLVGNTLFVLCIGSYWGFQHFPRFTIPALPALFWAIRGLLPRRGFWWAFWAVLICLCASGAVMHEYVVPR